MMLGVKRALLITALCLTGTALWPLAAEAGKTVDSFCSKSGDYCTEVSRSNGQVVLELRTFSFSDKYKLCVEPPDGERECGYFFNLKKGKHGIYTSRVGFRDNFFSHGKGQYKVTWYYGGKTRLGPPLYFTVEADLP